MLKKIKTKLISFGSNLLTQLGIGSGVVSSKTPVTIIPKENNGKNKSGGYNPIKIACGSLHTLFINADQKLYSFGCNDEGALGREGDEEYPEEVIIPHLGNDNIVEMACGHSTSFILTNKGNLYGWGVFRGNSGSIGFFTREKTKNKTRFKRELKVSKQPQTSPILIEKNVSWISVGSNHAVYKTKKGIYCIGGNLMGEKGMRPHKRLSKLEQIKPTLMFNTRSDVFKNGKVFCGYNNTFIIDSNGCSAFGNNSNYQFGNESNCGAFIRPVDILNKVNKKESDEIEKSPKVAKKKRQEKKRNKRFKKDNEEEKIVKVVSGETHSVFLTSLGKVYSAGENGFQQLGMGKESPQFVLDGVKDIKCGGFFTAALKKDNKIISWGFNSYGELGHQEKFGEMQVENVQQLALGHDFVVAAVKDKNNN